MTIKAKRSRHVAVAVHQFPVGGLVTTGLRQQGTQPQHLEIAYPSGKINRHVRKPVERGLGFREIAVVAAGQ